MKNRYLDEGSYGCVIKPSIKKIKKKTVSKYFIDKKEWLNEFKKKHIVKLIDYCITLIINNFKY